VLTIRYPVDAEPAAGFIWLSPVGNSLLGVPMSLVLGTYRPNTNL